jgi:ankyrin repeat protein
MSFIDDLPRDVSKYIIGMTDMSSTLVSKQFNDYILSDDHVFSGCVVGSFGSEKKAFVLAVRHGKTSVVKTLFSKHSALREDNCFDEALFDAINHNHISVVEFFLSFDYNILAWAPILCANCGHVKLFKMLMTYPHLSCEGDYELHQDIMINTCEAGHIDMVKFLIDMPNTNFPEYYRNGRPLAAAAKEGHADIVNFLLSRAPKVPKGYALLQAAEYGHTNIVKILLECPVNPPSANHQNGRALLFAAAMGYNSIVSLLLNCPKNPPMANCRDGLALVLAAIEGRNDTVKLLLEWPRYAPDADCQDGEALVMAAQNGHESIVKMLLEWPTNAPDGNCQEGKALDLADENKHFAIFEMIYATINNDDEEDDWRKLRR